MKSGNAHIFKDVNAGIRGAYKTACIRRQSAGKVEMYIFFEDVSAVIRTLGELTRSYKILYRNICHPFWESKVYGWISFRPPPPLFSRIGILCPKSWNIFPTFPEGLSVPTGDKEQTPLGPSTCKLSVQIMSTPFPVMNTLMPLW